MSTMPSLGVGAAWGKSAQTQGARRLHERLFAITQLFETSTAADSDFGAVPVA